MKSADLLKATTSEIIKKYSPKSNFKASLQFFNTLIPYFLLFYLAIESIKISYWLTAALLIPLSLFTVRIFMLMHDCGHMSLFKSRTFNAIGGFISGVFVGMPQYVWSQHHSYHHATNGNWEKYRGPLNILSVNQYKELSPAKQRSYRLSRNILLAPLGAFMYFIFNPRFNWMLGSLLFIINVSLRKIINFRLPLKTIIANYESKFWQSGKEYFHMSLNNIVLIGIWIVASWYFGIFEFLSIYIISLSFAGAAGLIIFTIQHNFEESYASDNEAWDYHKAAISGTSFLTFPKYINWFGLDIAYHHIHHVSASIPNYNLAKCHREYTDLFDDVTRIRLRDINKSFKYILWDEEKQKLTTINNYNQNH